MPTSSKRSSDTVNRRQFQQATASLLTFSLLETLFQNDLFADEIRPVTAAWLAELNQLGHDLKGEKLKQVEWQAKVEALFRKVDMPQLLKFVDFDKLQRTTRFRDRGERSMRPRFPEVEGLPTRLVFGHQIFALKKGRSVVPHGHDNMATAFLVLKGAFHGRHYDRLEDIGKDFMVVQPTIDRGFSVGEYSTVSDHKDNVHWFRATEDGSFIFNIHVLNVEEGRTSGRIYIDPAGEKLQGGRIKARRIKPSEAYKLYG